MSEPTEKCCACGIEIDQARDGDPIMLDVLAGVRHCHSCREAKLAAMRTKRPAHVPTSDWHIVSCKHTNEGGIYDCDAVLRSPFPPRPHDPDGLGTFAVALANEFGIGNDEISTTDVARAWATAMGWAEVDDEWECPKHNDRKAT